MQRGVARPCAIGHTAQDGERQRRIGDKLEVLLAHPGGPFWVHRDVGAWSIPKGLVADGEEPLAAACREFEEETGVRPTDPFLSLGSVTVSP